MSCNEWKEYALEDIIEEFIDYRGRTPKKTDNGVPLITAKIVKQGRINPPTEFIKEEDYDTWMTRGIPLKGDVILTTEAPLGEVAQIKDSKKVALAQRIITLRGKREILDNTFLKYSLQSPIMQHRLFERASGTTVIGIKSAELKKVNINLPPLEEQVKIANILSSLDDKIELNNEMNKTLEEMAQSIFKRWFVDFEFPNEDGQPYKSSGGEMVDSELGMIPKGWEVKSLDELTDVGIGKTPPRKEYQWFSLNNEDVKWVSIKDMGNCGTYILETSEYLTNEAIEKFKVKKVPSNTVILSFKLTVGRVAISPCELVTNEAIAHFKIQNSENLTTEFLYSYLKQFNYDLLGSTSSIATAVNSKIIRKIPIIVPPSEIMSKFTSNVSSLFELIKENELEIINLREMRDSLLPKLMSGEIDLSK